MSKIQELHEVKSNPFCYNKDQRDDMMEIVSSLFFGASHTEKSFAKNQLLLVPRSFVYVSKVTPRGKVRFAYHLQIKDGGQINFSGWVKPADTGIIQLTHVGHMVYYKGVELQLQGDLELLIPRGGIGYVPPKD